MLENVPITVQVGCIATFNAKDFRPASQFGIQIVSPKTLLESLP